MFLFYCSNSILKNCIKRGTSDSQTQCIREPSRRYPNVKCLHSRRCFLQSDEMSIYCQNFFNQMTFCRHLANKLLIFKPNCLTSFDTASYKLRSCYEIGKFPSDSMLVAAHRDLLCRRVLQFHQHSTRKVSLDLKCKLDKMKLELRHCSKRMDDWLISLNSSGSGWW